MIEVKTFACSNKREAEAEEDRVMRELKGDRTPIGTRVYPNCATH